MNNLYNFGRMKYIFFSDIDGTIYDHQQIILQSTIDDVMFAQKQGVEFVIATGNGYFNSIKKLAHKLNVRYLILSNGSQIFDVKKNTSIYENLISQSLAQTILDIAITFNLSIIWWNQGGVYLNTKAKTQVVKKVMEFIHQKNVKLTNKITQDIYKIEFIGEANVLDKVLKKMEKLPLNLIRMHPQQVEIVNENVSKGHAIQQFCQLFKINLKNVGAIGDSHNDLEMLSVVKHSYAMINGHPNTLKAARYQALHVLDNGVGQALHDFIDKILKKT